MRARKTHIQGLLAVALLVGPSAWTSSRVFAQPRNASSTSPTTKPVSFASVFDARAGEIEADIGRLMQRRVDDTAGVPRELELRIDVRIVARWMFAEAGKAQQGSDLQACGWIRGNDLLAAALLAEQEFDAATGRPATTDAATKALRDLTFKLGEAKSPADFDAASRTAAMALLAAMGGDATARLPQMRPPADPAATSPDVIPQRTLEQLSSKARELAVSTQLRAQLVAFSLAAGQLAQDPKKKADAEEARSVLDDAVTLAEGFQANTAVEREDREKMESQVAQGLAMYLDPRTRTLGRKHVSALGEYRRMLGRLRAMNLPAEQFKRFGPIFSWAQRNPDGSGKAMGAVELFAKQDVRFASPTLGAELNGVAAKAAAEAKKRATSARESFLTATSAAFDKPDVLTRLAEVFRDEVDALDAIARSPDALKVINTFRPKPYGAIDKRVQTAWIAWANESSDADRRSAAQFLSQLSKLADHGRDLTDAAANAAANDKDPARRRYTNGLTEQFNTRRRALVTEIASNVATGKSLDEAALAPLERMAAMLAAVRVATEAERTLVQAETLERWVDWGVQRTTLDAVLAPYRSVTADAFEGLARGGAAPLPAWESARKRYEPLLGLLTRVAAKGDACAAFPPGRTGALAKLTTPLDGQPFATERAARLSLDAWAHLRQSERGDADPVLDALSARLTRP